MSDELPTIANHPWKHEGSGDRRVEWQQIRSRPGAGDDAFAGLHQIRSTRWRSEGVNYSAQPQVSSRESREMLPRCRETVDGERTAEAVMITADEEYFISWMQVRSDRDATGKKPLRLLGVLHDAIIGGSRKVKPDGVGLVPGFLPPILFSGEVVGLPFSRSPSVGLWSLRATACQPLRCLSLVAPAALSSLPSAARGSLSSFKLLRFPSAAPPW